MNSLQKSYNNQACLYLVPTPIGNLEDITARSIKVLSEVKVIFAEDTRVTLELLNALNIKNKVYSCHKFSEVKNSELVLSFLEKGESIALVTDRGTPLISDPGSVVVSKVIEKNYNVVALPGACAFIPALNMSGLEQDKFLFYGFLSSKESQNLTELEKIKTLNFTTVLYEAPHRLYKTLQNMLKILGNRQISISREITKIHEEVYRGDISGALEIYKEVKGEIVIVISKEEKDDNYEIPFEEAKELINLGLKQSDALKYVAKKYDVSKNILYSMLEENKK